MIGKENIDSAEMSRIIELLRKETDVQQRLLATATDAAAKAPKPSVAGATSLPSPKSPKVPKVAATSQLDAFIPPPPINTGNGGKSVSVQPPSSGNGPKAV